MNEKRTDRIRRIVKNPDFIPGVYNYCDRWCSRCRVQKRCSVYAMESEERRAPSVAEDDGFAAPLEESLTAAASLLRELAAEAGLDLDAAVSESEREDLDRRDRQAENHLLVCTAHKYTEAVHQWLSERGVWEGTEEEAGHEMEPSDPLQPGEDLRVILHFHTLVGSKIFRAVHGLLEEGPEGPDAGWSDADGSAKVALIGVDRSAAAWSRLLDAFPEDKHSIRDFLFQLERIRRAAEWTFPRARGFVRPGFDE